MPDIDPVLVTGGMGAIGSWVVRQLVQERRPFVVYDWRADYTLLADIRDRVPFVEGDLLDRDRLAGVVREMGARRIIHLAALMPPACEEDPALGYRVNLLGALGVFDVARALGLERVVFASSKAAYGAITGAHAAPTFTPVTEDYVGPPLIVYGGTKRALEEAAYHYRRLWNTDLIALRLGSTYGPGKLARHGAVGTTSRIVEMAFRGEPYTVPTPDATDDVVYNRDVAKAVLLACWAPRPTHWQFNVSSETLASQRAFAEEAMRLCPRHKLTVPEGTAAPPSVGTYGLLSNARARAELGYTPDFPGVTGVRDYVSWLQRMEATSAPGRA